MKKKIHSDPMIAFIKALRKVNIYKYELKFSRSPYFHWLEYVLFNCYEQSLDIWINDKFVIIRDKPFEIGDSRACFVFCDTFAEAANFILGWKSAVTQPIRLHHSKHDKRTGN